MYKLLLIEPSPYNSNGRGVIKNKILFTPGLIFPLLAAMVPENWEVEAIYESVEGVDFETDADLIGLNAMGIAVFRSLDIAREYKKRGKAVFMGGYMASMNQEFVLEVVDSVIVGDAEISIPLLLNDFVTKGCLNRIYDNPVNDIRDLPKPKYELLLDKPIGNMLPVQAARGCQHQCSFCSIAAVCKGRYMSRNVEEVIEDIKEIKRLGYKRFLLMDDNLLGNSAFLDEFVTVLKPLKMKWSAQCTINIARNPTLLKKVAEAGCEVLSIGLESINQNGLNNVNKQWVKVHESSRLIDTLYKVGIVPKVQFMLGLDNDNIESVQATYQFIMQHKIPIVRLYIMTPIPGTKIFHEFKADSRLIHEELVKYDSMQCVYYPKNINPEKLDSMYWWFLGQLLSINSILKRTVFNWKRLRSPFVALTALWINLQYRKHFKRREMPTI